MQGSLLPILVFYIHSNYCSWFKLFQVSSLYCREFKRPYSTVVLRWPWKGETFAFSLLNLKVSAKEDVNYFIAGIPFEFSLTLLPQAARARHLRGQNIKCSIPKRMMESFSIFLSFLFLFCIWISYTFNVIKGGKFKCHQGGLQKSTKNS